MKTRQMKAKIMRRVYYTYAISIATHSMLWRGVFLGAALLLLAHRLHVASIYHNFLATPVGNVPQYTVNVLLGAAGRGEVLLLLTLLAVTVIGLSCLYQIAQSLASERPFAHPA